jgi:hypothetical protein
MPKLQVQPCHYKMAKTLGSGSYSTVQECVHIDTGRYYAAKVINKWLMAGREHIIYYLHRRVGAGEVEGQGRGGYREWEATENGKRRRTQEDFV